MPFFLTSWKKIPRNQRCFGLKETNLFPIFRSRQKPIYLWLSNTWIIPSKKFPWELKVFEILEMYLFHPAWVWGQERENPKIVESLSNLLRYYWFWSISILCSFLVIKRLAHCCAIFLGNLGIEIYIDDWHRHPIINIREIIWLGNQLRLHWNCTLLLLNFNLIILLSHCSAIALYRSAIALLLLC